MLIKEFLSVVKGSCWENYSSVCLQFKLTHFGLNRTLGLMKAADTSLLTILPCLWQELHYMM